MTEAELWHMMLLAADNTFSGMAGIASITFAYLAAAYFVGAKLSRFQAAVATVSFTRLPRDSGPSSQSSSTDELSSSCAGFQRITASRAWRQMRPFCLFTRPCWDC